MDAKIKHLEFIQNTINRMAGNSFLLKGWTVTIIIGLFALSLKELNKLYVEISSIVLIFFWLLDGYYLYQEKLFINLYDHTRKLSEKDINFSMGTKPYREKVNWLRCSCSKTMGLFYGGLFVAHIIVFYLI